jgi:YVTN family beta-propeller protein
MMPDAATAGKQHLWVTNAYGDDVHVIDVAMHKVIHHLTVGPQPHGIAAPDNPAVVYLAIENFKGPVGELLWVNPRTYAIEHRLSVGPKPNQIACTPDGKWVYVPCDDGTYWVVDGEKKEVVTRIQTGGRPHNTQAARDGKHMYLSPMGSPRRVTIVDLAAGHKVVGEIPFSNVVRPPALSADEKRLYQNVDGLLGFEVADVATRKVIARIHHNIPAEFQQKPSRSHGLAIRPDQKEIWSCNVEHQLVHVHDLTSDEFPEIATLPMVGKVYWLCFTPDSKYAYVSVRSERKVCVVNAATKQIVTHIDVGDNPKRNLVITLPDE